ncbi:MAG: hypothetical protein ABIO72_00715 [Patescibacteria group bacterium]
MRATVWPGSNEVGWRDVVHDHFGCIVTTALTPVAYDEARYEHIEQRTLSSIVPLRCGDIRVIVPATVHRIIPSREGRGVSLSVRTRALRVSASERQEPEGIARPRTRGQVDTRRTILATLGQL